MNPTDTRRYKATLDGLPRYNRMKIISSMVRPESKVLDIGCGPGLLGEHLIKEKDCTVWGVDWSQETLDVATQRGLATFRYNLNDGLPKLPKFDYIIANEMWEHVFYPEKLAKAVYNALGDGELIASFTNSAYWKTRLNLLKGRVDDIMTGDVSTDGSESFIHHFHVFDRRLMLRLLQDFTVLEERCPGRLGIPTLAMQIIFRCKKR